MASKYHFSCMILICKLMVNQFGSCKEHVSMQYNKVKLTSVMDYIEAYLLEFEPYYISGF